SGATLRERAERGLHEQKNGEPGDADGQPADEGCREDLAYIAGLQEISIAGERNHGLAILHAATQQCIVVSRETSERAVPRGTSRKIRRSHVYPGIRCHRYRRRARRYR